MKVAILGCGPAGLMAAHAAAIQGCEVVIFSRKVKSPIYGAQYLHSPIPYVTNLEHVVKVNYSFTGTADQYRSKVYGQSWIGLVSPEDLTEPHDAWDLRATYDHLWRLYHKYINSMEIDQFNFTVIQETEVSLIVNSVPREALCLGGHYFGASEIWAAGDAPDLGIKIPYNCPENTVLCNGEREPAWYRLSNIYGHKTVEWPGSIESKPPIQTCSKVRKPTWTDCKCWLDESRLLHVGRYGRWEKGYLSHEAFQDTAQAIISIRRGVRPAQEHKEQRKTEATSGGGSGH